MTVWNAYGIVGQPAAVLLDRDGKHQRGAYMITATPTRQTTAPVMW